MEVSAADFEELVGEALDELPPALARLMDNVAIFVEDEAPGDEELLGIYEGIALTERDRYGFGELPDRIVLFREPLLAVCDDLAELRDEIHVTLVHEIAHYYGIDDEELHRLGWA